MLTNVEALTSISRQNAAFATQCVREWSKGFQAVGTEMLSFGSRSFEDGSRTLEELLTVRTVEDAIEVQNNFVKQRYDDWVNQLGKLSSVFVSMSKAAYNPINHAVSNSVFATSKEDHTKH